MKSSKCKTDVGAAYIQIALNVALKHGVWKYFGHEIYVFVRYAQHVTTAKKGTVSAPLIGHYFMWKLNLLFEIHRTAK